GCVAAAAVAALEPGAPAPRLLAALLDDWTDRQAGDDGLGWRQRAAAPGPPARQRLHGRCRRFAREPLEHVQVLALDDRPRVVAGEVLAAVPPQSGGQRRREVNRAQRLDELGEALVVQTAVAADALALEHVAPAVGQHRLAERPGFEGHHRQALEVR